MSQGSRFQQLSGKKSSLAVAMFTILALHAAVLGGLLIQGCKQEPAQPEPNATESTATNEVVKPPTEPKTGLAFYDNSFPGDAVTTNPPPVVPNQTNAVAAAPEAPVAGGTNQAISGVQGLQGLAPVAGEFGKSVPTSLDKATATNQVAAAPLREHKVASGESFAKIAHLYPGVSVKALMAANPGVGERYLQVGQILKVPAAEVKTNAVSKTTATTERPAPGSEVKDTAGQITYVVAAGDNLTRIAKKYGVRVSALKTENRLAGDRINVGQKLKIPTVTSTNTATKVDAATTATNAVAPVTANQAGTTPTASTGEAIITKLGN